MIFMVLFLLLKSQQRVRWDETSFGRSETEISFWRRAESQARKESFSQTVEGEEERRVRSLGASGTARRPRLGMKWDCMRWWSSASTDPVWPEQRGACVDVGVWWRESPARRERAGAGAGGRLQRLPGG